MTFLWHHALWLLFALPALAGMYFLLLRRKDQPALQYTGLGLARAAAGPAQALRPHVPPLLLFVGLTALVLAVARPVLIVTTTSEQGTVILLMDVSLSMAATDVPPTRLAAARAAAVEFVKAQPRDVRIGIVAFGGYADIVQPPTANRADVLAALDQLELQRFTAIGNGLIGALLTLVPTADIGGEYDIFGNGRMPANGGTRFDKAHAAGGKPKAVAPGSYLSTAIILVSDGRGTMGVAPAKAAKMAADLGIRVYTVGVGTLYGGVANIEGWPPIHADFDEDILKEIAAVTRGEYFLARSADKVARIYDTLGRRVILERMEREITALFTVIGVLLALASAGLSLLWSSRQSAG
jgi:Ca-activated chloride channel family protein